MDDKKQKILLVVLAVMGLGAGGYFVFLRDSGASNNQANQGVSTERVERKTAKANTGREGRTARTTSKRKSAAPTARVARTAKAERKTERVKRGAGKRAITKKKKKTSPAA